jgi:phosphatidylglycerophosphate synthase
VAVIRFTVGKIVVRPRMTGKLATVLQMAVVIWILLKWDAAGQGALWLKYLELAASICTGVSGLLYVLDGIKQLGSHPASSATKK